MNPKSASYATPVFLSLTTSVALLASMPAHADTAAPSSSMAIPSIDGAPGGVLTPWAMSGVAAAQGEATFSASISQAGTRDFRLNIVGATAGFHDRFEVSLAQQNLTRRGNSGVAGVPDAGLKQTILGARARVLGDAQTGNTALPQVSAGVELKTLGTSSLDATLNALGVKRRGTDFYVSATQRVLGRSLLLNGTLRATKANQNGLLGFGTGSGSGKTGYGLQPEFSAAWQATNQVTVGAEYRFMGNQPEGSGSAAGMGNALRGDDWKDVFVAWSPSRQLSLTMAYIDLGTVVPGPNGGRKQTGYYLSGQAAF